MSYAGMILSVDLTNNQIEKIPLTEQLKTGFIGGQGINAKLVYDLVKPGIDPLSPENVLVFGAGVLCGTMMPTAARACAMAKSPIHGFITISNSGRIGAMMKFAGYDHIIIKGKAEQPVFLKIEDDNVEILDAGHLWGKNIRDATELLWKELGEKYWVICIGQAGENLVRFANMMSNKWGAFGRGGHGAVMGSKNLKAIAIYGTKGVKIANRRRFMKVVDETIEAIRAQDLAAIYRSGGSYELGMHVGEEATERMGMGDKNAEKFVDKFIPSAERFSLRTHRMDADILHQEIFFEQYKVMASACLACPVGCHRFLESVKGGNKGQTLGVSCGGTMHGPYGIACAVTDFDDVGILTELGQGYGFGAHEISGILGFVMELYEKGVISKKDTDGLEMEWGNTSALQELMRKIAMREGFGNILADGIVEATKRIGKESEPYLIHIKGMSPLWGYLSGGGPPFSSTESSIELMYMVNPRGPHLDHARYPRENFAKDGPEGIRQLGKHLGIPEEIVDRVLEDDKHYNLALWTRHIIPYNVLVQSLGTCDRPVAENAMPAELLTEAYCAATGIEASTTELLRAGDRAWNLEKAFNIREGASKKDDMYPERAFREPLDTSLQIGGPLDREKEEALLDEFYKVEEWDKETGKPTRKRLEELDLQDVAKDLEF